MLGTQLRVQNKVYDVDPSTDLEMCKAIVRSMPRPPIPTAPVLCGNADALDRSDSAHVAFLLCLGDILLIYFGVDFCCAARMPMNPADT